LALEKSGAEFEAYKSSVSSHFSKTSELVNDLTQDYVKVYKHLAEGAQILGDPRGGMDLLEQQGKVLLSVADTSGVDDISAAENEQPAQPDESEQEQLLEEGAQQAPGLIDDDSRDYISETIREAADIAGKIDEEKEPASPPAEAAADSEQTEESAGAKKRES
jgi:uncharacterized membrane-anchored protein YhcB (DUF1043 family)